MEKKIFLISYGDFKCIYYLNKPNLPSVKCSLPELRSFCPGGGVVVVKSSDYQICTFNLFPKRVWGIQWLWNSLLNSNGQPDSLVNHNCIPRLLIIQFFILSLQQLLVSVYTDGLCKIILSPSH